MVRRAVCGLLLALLLCAPAGAAGVGAFAQAVAEATAGAPGVAAFYRKRDFAPIWTGADADDEARLRALATALADAPLHGLPAGRYGLVEIRTLLATVATEEDRARAEVALSRLFLRYARDVATGVVEPGEADAGIKRKAPRRDAEELLGLVAGDAPEDGFRALPPAAPEYLRLLDAKLRLQGQIAAGGWGEAVPARRIERGDVGPDVLALRNRLIRMGYLPRTLEPRFDGKLEAAVRAFQSDHGLMVDGIVGPGTGAELNVAPQERLGQVLVALERERWINFDRGERHIWVNLTDFTAEIVDGGKVTFSTRAVVGSRESDRQSPEFSDEMEHLVVNPTWHVPRSIVVKEYLPQLQKNPAAAGHLRLIDSRGRTIDRTRVDFTQFDANTFPFAMKEPPSRSNALGLVKFMFPNRWNIYLHDTPAKSLFDRDSRAFSHGCIRLNDPFEFAYRLLERQTDDPRGLFQARLDTGRETVVPLETHVPVHIVYRTAFTTPRGDLQFRRDIYGRDARVLDALKAAGVALEQPQS